MDEYYKKRKGGGGMPGTDYQLEVITLFFLKAYENQWNFKISSESLTDGKLDDVVLLEDQNNILAQIKHIEKEDNKIHLEALFSEDHVFSLIALLKSFMIKYGNHLKKLNQDIQCLPEEKNDESTLKNQSKIVLESFEKGCDTHIVEFQKLVPTLRELKNESLTRQVDWFEKNTICLITNVEPHLEVKKNIAVEKKYNETDYFYVEGDEVYYMFNPDEMLEKLTSILLANVLKEKNSTSLIKYFFETLKSILSISVPREKTPIFLIKYFFEKFQLIVIKNSVLERNIKSLLHQLDLFKKGNWDFDTVHNQIRNKMKEWYLYYRGNNGYYLKPMHLEVFFADICSGSYVKQLKEFESKFHFKIENLVAKINENQFTLIKSPRYFLLMVKLQEKLTTEIERGQILFVNPCENIEIQTGLTKSFIYHRYTHYICPLLPNKNYKIISEINEILLEIKKRKYKKIILISEVDLNYINTRINVISDEDLYSELTLTGTRRLKSLGDIEKYYVTRSFRHKYDYLSEKKFLKTIIKDGNKFVLIVDGPGMGKTTLLNSLTCQINKMDNLWAINIELNRYTNVLKRSLSSKPLQAEDFLPFSNNSNLQTLQDIVECQILTIPNVICLLVDAVDEVSPKYTDVVLKFLHSSSEKVAKIVVTAREHLKTKLTDSLKVTPYTLEIFNKKEQKKFIMSFWIQNLNLEDEDTITKCETYCEKLLKHLESCLTNRFWNFLGIPLQTRMVAEIFLKGISSELTGCQQFLEADNLDPILPVNLSLGQLYDLFIERKREIYIDEKCNIQGNVSAEKGLTKEFDEYVKVCKNLALMTIFEQKDWYHFNEIDENVEFSDDNFYKIGLVILPAEKWKFVKNESSSKYFDTSNEENPQFIHRSCAEYFVAKTICHHLFQYDNAKVEFPSFLVSEVFLKPGLVVVHQFIECDLKNNWKLITSSLIRLFSEVLDKTSISEEQNLNHLARRSCLHILKLLLDATQKKKEWINELYGDEKDNILLESVEYIDIVKFLVEHGADVNIKGIFNKTALHYASENGYLEVVEYLVGKVDNIDAETEAGFTPLHEAIFNKHFAVATCLIENGACVQKRTGGGWSCLHYATLTENKNLIEIFLEKGIDINDQTTKNLPGRTALHIALEKRYFDICEFLFTKNINFNLKDADGCGMWSYAVRGEKQIFEFVKNKNQHYDIEKDCEALTLAVENGDLEMVENLLDLGFDIDSRNQEGWTPLQKAIRGKRFEICETLLKQNANVQVRSDDDSTIIHLAAATGDLKLFMLLETHQDINGKTKEGKTCLHFAAESGELELVEYLWKKLPTSISLDTSFDGRTTLHYAACSSDIDVVKFFVGKNVLRLDTKATNGDTVLHEAASKANLDVIKYIIAKLKQQKVDLNFKSTNGLLTLYRPNPKFPADVTEVLLEAGVKKEAIIETPVS